MPNGRGRTGPNPDHAIPRPDVPVVSAEIPWVTSRSRKSAKLQYEQRVDTCCSTVITYRIKPLNTVSWPDWYFVLPTTPRTQDNTRPG